MQGTDGHYFKFSASVELRTPNKTVGKPSQVYIAFKKIDYRSGEQLQINAQAIYNEEVKRFVGTVDPDLVCTICLDVVSDIDSWITSDATEDQIVDWLHNICEVCFKNLVLPIITKNSYKHLVYSVQNNK